MKTEKELRELKAKVEELDRALGELTEDELLQVTAGNRLLIPYRGKPAKDGLPTLGAPVNEPGMPAENVMSAVGTKVLD